MYNVVSKSIFIPANSSRIINCSITGDSLQAGHALAMNNKERQLFTLNAGNQFPDRDYRQSFQVKLTSLVNHAL